MLFQLPPAMKCDVALLARYLELLPAGHALCLRVPPRVVAGRRGLRRAAPSAISRYASRNRRSWKCPEVITADFVYYRLRKPDYTADDIDAIAARSKELLATGRDLYLMFKHEETPEGALNAESVLKKAAAGS